MILAGAVERGDDDTVNKSFSHQTTSVYTELLAVKEGSNARVGSVGVILLVIATYL